MKTVNVEISTGQIFEIPVIDKSERDISNLLRSGYYNNKHIPKDLLEYPYRPTIEKKLRDNILDTFVGTSRSINIELSKCKDEAKKIQEIAMADYLLIYPNREQEFMNDMFEHFGVTGNPKADKAYSIAYEKGHSSGYSEVYNEFSDIVELIK